MALQSKIATGGYRIRYLIGSIDEFDEFDFTLE
jgi:hypothetical protein